MLPKFYYERRKRKKQKIFVIGIVLLLLSSVLISFFYIKFPTATDVLKHAAPLTLKRNATLEITTLYTCGHSKTKLLPIPADLIGKSREEAELLYPNLTFLNFNEEFIVAEEKQETECDEHFRIYLNENKIIVTKSKDSSHIITEQEINRNLLTDEDLAILSAGIFVNSEYELLEIMESFQ